MNKISNLSSLVLPALLAWIAASTPAIAQSSGEPTVESKVFQIESSAATFNDVLQEVGAELPEDFSGRIESLSQLAEQGRTDPKAAAAYHDTLSGIMTDMGIALDEVIDDIPNIKSELNRYKSELESGRAGVEANIEQEQMEYKDTEARLREQQHDLVRVSLKAKQLRDAGRVLPLNLQNRLKKAEQGWSATERKFQAHRKNLKTYKGERADYAQLAIELNAKEEQLEEYWRLIQSDRDVLQLAARGQLSAVNRSRLQAVLRDHGAITNQIRPGIKLLEDHLESVDAADEDVVFDVPEDKNSDSTNSIIDRWAKEELLHQDAL